MSNKLDPIQIARMKFNETLNADRVELAGDVAIELSAEDGDSVIIKKQTIAEKVESGQTLDLSSASKVMLAGDVAEATLVLLVDNMSVLEIAIYKGVIKEVCLTNVQINFTGQNAVLLIQ